MTKGGTMNRIIIDVREPIEYKMGHVKGAINIPPSQLMAGAKQLGFTNLVNGINKEHVKSKYL